jgi:hypothetical protein
VGWVGEGKGREARCRQASDQGGFSWWAVAVRWSRGWEGWGWGTKKGEEGRYQGREVNHRQLTPVRGDEDAYLSDSPCTAVSEPSICSHCPLRPTSPHLHRVVVPQPREGPPPPPPPPAAPNAQRPTPSCSVLAQHSTTAQALLLALTCTESSHSPANARHTPTSSSSRCSAPSTAAATCA